MRVLWKKQIRHNFGDWIVYIVEEDGLPVLDYLPVAKLPEDNEDKRLIERHKICLGCNALNPDLPYTLFLKLVPEDMQEYLNIHRALHSL